MKRGRRVQFGVVECVISFRTGCENKVDEGLLGGGEE